MQPKLANYVQFANKSTEKKRVNLFSYATHCEGLAYIECRRMKNSKEH